MAAKNIPTTSNDDADDDGLESVLGGDDEFQEAALFVQNNLLLFSRNDLLYLYARFKQVKFENPFSINIKLLSSFLKVTIGDVNIPRPGYFSTEGRPKW